MRADISFRFTIPSERSSTTYDSQVRSSDAELDGKPILNREGLPSDNALVFLRG